MRVCIVQEKKWTRALQVFGRQLNSRQYLVNELLVLWEWNSVTTV